MNIFAPGWFTELCPSNGDCGASPKEKLESGPNEKLESGQNSEKDIVRGNVWSGQANSLKVAEDIYHQKSKYQDIRVFKSATFGNVLVLDGMVQCTERDECSYQEMLAHIPLTVHPNPKKVLIIGGGDGGILREVVKHESVDEAVLCEIDEEVINVSKRYLPAMAEGFSSPKAKIHVGDGFEFMKQHQNEFDVIITDSSDPVGPAEALFGETYYDLVKSALTEHGILASQGESMWYHLDLINSMMTFCRRLFPVVSYAYSSVPTYPSGVIGYLICSKDPNCKPEDPRTILTKAQIGDMALHYYNSEVHKAAFVLPEFVRSVQCPGAVSCTMYWFLALCLLVCRHPSTTSGTRGTELEKKLMTGYSAAVRPSRRMDEKTDVYITLFIQHIESVDDWRQTIKVHGALHMNWHDHRLYWRREDYNNTDMIMMNDWNVWTPDVHVLNSVDGNKQPFFELRHEALLFSSGFVSLTRDFSFTTSCPLSHKLYPHDAQRCPIVLASLMYDYSQVDWNYGFSRDEKVVIEERLDWRLKKKQVSGWKFVNATGRKAYLTRTGIQYDAPVTSKGPVGWIWPMIIAEVEMIRHKPYFYLLEVFPMLVTAVLTLTSFWVDAPLLTLAILMSTVIAQGYFSWDLFAELPPATDGMPRLAIAYSFNFAMTSIAFLIHVLVQYLDQRDSIADLIPSAASNFVDTMQNTTLIGGQGIRLFPRPPSQSSMLEPTDPTGTTNQAQSSKNPSITRIQKVTLVARRVFFWAYVLTYSIFAVALALSP